MPDTISDADYKRIQVCTWADLFQRYQELAWSYFAIFCNTGSARWIFCDGIVCASSRPLRSCNDSSSETSAKLHLDQQFMPHHLLLNQYPAPENANALIVEIDQVQIGNRL